MPFLANELQLASGITVGFSGSDMILTAAGDIKIGSNVIATTADLGSLAGTDVDVFTFNNDDGAGAAVLYGGVGSGISMLLACNETDIPSPVGPMSNKDGSFMMLDQYGVSFNIYDTNSEVLTLNMSHDHDTPANDYAAIKLGSNAEFTFDAAGSLKLADDTNDATVSIASVSGSQTYTLPAAGGTIALTSDILAAPFVDSVSICGLIGNANVATINAVMTPAIGDAYVVTDAGTLTIGSLAVVAGDLVEYSGNSWTMIAANSGGFVPGGIRAVLSSVTALITPYTDATDDNKIVEFSGSSNTGVDTGEATIGTSVIISQGIKFNTLATLYGATVAAGSWDIANFLPAVNGVVPIDITLDNTQLVFDTGAFTGTLQSFTITSVDKIWMLPDTAGTIALTSDIPVVDTVMGSVAFSAVTEMTVDLSATFSAISSIILTADVNANCFYEILTGGDAGKFKAKTSDSITGNVSYFVKGTLV